MHRRDRTKVLKLPPLEDIRLKKIKCRLHERIVASFVDQNYTDSINSNLRENLTALKRLAWLRACRRKAGYAPSLLMPVERRDFEETNLINAFRSQPPEMIWLSAVRNTVLMILAYGAMMKPFKEHEKVTQKSILNEFRVPLNAMETMALTYDYKAYICEQDATVPANVIKIMAKNEHSRSWEDIMAIYSVMLNLPIFQMKYSRKMCWKLAKYFRYFKCEMRRIMTLSNRNPIRVYFIYSGEVNVLFHADENEDFTTTSHKKAIKLTRGACIGHMARTQLCVCATDCEFFTIDKVTFVEKGLYAVLEQEFEEKFEFFRKWLPISDWSDNAVYDLASVSFIDNYPTGSLILQDIAEKDSDLIWFVVKGIVDIVKVTTYKACEILIHGKEEDNPAKIKKQKLAQFSNTILKKIIPKPLIQPADCPEKTAHFIAKRLTHPATKFEKSTEKLMKKSTKPVYLKIQSLVRGECYGLGKVDPDHLQDYRNKFCLISRDSLVIRTPCTELKNLIEILGIDRKELKNAIVMLPTEEEICVQIKNNLYWKCYVRSEVKYKEKKNLSNSLRV
ncbi:hypothetical protein HELRODRAFT_177300 [Helobdella robusta]|uniref:Cyclic nucleotide-binding domain-containing protein n=1 Tax=Helobdella robusta TaxID=6412 RepID=T1FBH2_HELRO|nr:hypothetical protein HELRODRAFT_177300 [Helobdella robusta]ESN98066.1 hypothetical protein HELRODRAFT_177300 [Helobdella robusta]